MKYDPDVNIIANEAAFLVAKATEHFIEVFAKHSYQSMQSSHDSNKRKTVQKKDVENAAEFDDKFVFLDGIEL